MYFGLALIEPVHGKDAYSTTLIIVKRRIGTEALSRNGCLMIGLQLPLSLESIMTIEQTATETLAKVEQAATETVEKAKVAATETVENRISIYNERTKPLVEYYLNTGRLTHIDGSSGSDNVFATIVSQLGE